MDLTEQKRFVLLQDINNEEGTIPKGSEITFFRGFVYMNGGMILPAYASIFTNILENDNLRKKYFKEIPIVYNKV